MKTYRITVRTVAGRQDIAVLARDGAEAGMRVWDMFPGQCISITIRGGRA